MVSNLMTSIHDVMDNKVKGYHVHLSSCMVEVCGLLIDTHVRKVSVYIFICVYKNAVI